MSKKIKHNKLSSVLASILGIVNLKEFAKILIETGTKTNIEI